MEIVINCLKAFLVSGGICLIGQVFIDLTKLTPARILVSFIVSGVVLSALGIYGPLVDFAGAGATVPLMGFGHLLAEGVKEAIDQFGFIGIFTGGLSAAAVGIGTAIVAGVICALIFKPGDKS